MTTPDEKQKIVANVLARFDSDGNQQITKQEFVNALLLENTDAATAQLIADYVFANHDKNRDNLLSYPEIEQLAYEWAKFPGDQSAP